MTSVSYVVVDTSVVSLIERRSNSSEYYRERLAEHLAVISFQTLEELRFGAFVNGWGSQRWEALLVRLRRYGVIWPDPALVETCARLRSERQRIGRRLEPADAWIAATALSLQCPLVSHDGDFDDIPGLKLIRSPFP